MVRLPPLRVYKGRCQLCIKVASKYAPCQVAGNNSEHQSDIPSSHVDPNILWKKYLIGFDLWKNLFMQVWIHSGHHLNAVQPDGLEVFHMRKPIHAQRFSQRNQHL